MEFKARQIRINRGNLGLTLSILWLFICGGNAYLYWNRYQFLIELGYASDNRNLYYFYFYIVAFIVFMIILLIKLRELYKVKKDLIEITINEYELILPNNRVIKLCDISKVLITRITIERINIYMKNDKRKKHIYNCYNEPLSTIVKEIENRISKE